MAWQISFQAIVSFLAAGIALVIMQIAWVRRRVPGVPPFAVMMLAAALWALGSGLEYASLIPSSKIFWSKFQYTGIATLPPLWLCFAMQYSQRDLWSHWRRLRQAIWVIPAITFLLAITNEQHNLIWSQITPIYHQGKVSLIYEHGVWFWIFAGYTYLALLGGTLVLAWTALMFPVTHRRQTWAILIGILFPWIANIVYLSGINPFVIDDPTPLAFVVTGIIYTFGVFRFQLFDLMPVAFDAVIESMPEGVVVIDERNQVIYANTSARAILDDGNPIGKDVIQLFERWSTKINFSLPSSATSIEITNTNGQTPTIDVVVSPLYNRFQRISGRIIVLRDITERKRTEERSRLQNVALDSAANGIVIADTQGTIIWANPAFYATTGYRPEEAIGQKTSLLKSGKHDAAFYKNLWDTITAGHTWHGQMTNRRKDGTFYAEEQTIAPVRNENGQITHFVAVKQDVSGRAEVEELRDELMHTLVHDLRNPLNSILVSLDMFRLVRVDLPDVLTDVLEVSRENAWRLLTMVNSILDISKLESGNMPVRRETVELAGLVEQTCHLQSSLAKRNEILLLNNVPYGLPTVEADATLIGRVLQNLLDNAIKFSPQGGNIVVNASIDTEKDAVIVSIEDQGPGLTDDMQGRIFQKFSVGHTTRSGTGLGLVFCRLAVEAHGGKIWVESIPDQGTSFIFTLPLQSNLS